MALLLLPCREAFEKEPVLRAGRILGFVVLMKGKPTEECYWKCVSGVPGAGQSTAEPAGAWRCWQPRAGAAVLAGPGTGTRAAGAAGHGQGTGSPSERTCSSP